MIGVENRDMQREHFPQIFYHLYNRGVSRRQIFHCDADYRFLMQKISKYAELHAINIMAYCLMPNHFHLLLDAINNAQDISLFMKKIQLSYAKYYNLRYQHSGHVFQGAYREKVIKDDVQLEQTKIYILNNPVRKGYVKKADQWRYSFSAKNDISLY
jgi:putative transposase